MVSLQPGYPNGFLISALLVSLVIKRWKRHTMTLRLETWDLWEARHMNRNDSTWRSAGAPRIMEIWIKCLPSSWGRRLWGNWEVYGWSVSQFHPAFCSSLKNVKVIWLLILETKGTLGVSVAHSQEAAETSVSTGDKTIQAPNCHLSQNQLAAMFWMALKSMCRFPLLKKEKMAWSLSLMYSVRSLDNEA